MPPPLASSRWLATVAHGGVAWVLWAMRVEVEAVGWGAPAWLAPAAGAAAIAAVLATLGRGRWFGCAVAAAIATIALAHAPLALAVVRGQYVALDTPAVARFAARWLLILGPLAAVLAAGIAASSRWGRGVSVHASIFRVSIFKQATSMPRG